MSDPSLSSSAKKVRDALERRGLQARVVEMPDTTRTAAEAAAAIGCEVAEIAKSLVFRGKTSGQAVLVIASGVNRVDEKAVARLVGEKIERATPEFVRQETGFAIGGVPPLGHPAPLLTLIDEDLLSLEEIWAAAGTPFAVFRTTPQDLAQATGGRVAQVARR